MKIAVGLPASTFRDLVCYAEILAHDDDKDSPPIDPAKLIALMVARFMATDRAFLKLRRATAAPDRTAKLSGA